MIVREDHACRFFQVIMANRSHFVVDLIIGRAEWRNKCVAIGSYVEAGVDFKNIRLGCF